MKASKRENLPFGTSPPCPSPRHHPSEGPSVHHNYGILELRCKEEGQGIGRQQVEANCTSARKTHVQSLGRVTLAYAILRSMQKQSTPKQRHSDHTTKLQNEPCLDACARPFCPRATHILTHAGDTRSHGWQISGSR